MPVLGPDGRPVDSEGKAKVLPGLDMSDPVTSVDLLAAVGKSCYNMAAGWARVAGPKGGKRLEIRARDMVGIASQGATVADFATNVMAELSFTLAEAEARVAVLKGLMPEDKVKAAEEADMAVAVEWQNRRNLFSGNVSIVLRKKGRIGLALAEAISGPAPTQDDFDRQVEEAKAAGLNVEKMGGGAEPPEKVPADGSPVEKFDGIEKDIQESLDGAETAAAGEEKTS